MSQKTTFSPTRRKRFGLVPLVSFAVVLTVSSPAFADRVEGSTTTYVGPSNSTQVLRWSQPDERIRLYAHFGGDPNGTATRCHDAFIDWNTNGTGHYDARVLRNCNPGHSFETDPGGNGWWSEPNDYDEADVRRVEQVGSYAFQDDDLTNIVNHEFLYGSVPSRAQPTSYHGQRIRTLYDNGTVSSFDHFPVRCAGDDTWVGEPGGNGGVCI